MFRIKRLIYFVCVVLLTISSCSINPENAATNIPPNLDGSSLTPRPVDTPTYTPISEEILTATPSLEPLPTLKTQCASSVSESQKLDLQDVIVLKRPDKQVDFQTIDESGQQPVFDYGFYLFDPNDKQIIKSINDGLLEQVSPDGKYLAYAHYDASGENKFLGILDSSGKVVNDFSLFLDGGWQDYYNWQNAIQLRVVAIANEDKVIVRLLDPFTREHNPLKTDWIGAYKPSNPYQDKVADWKFDKKATEVFYVYGANIFYDPTLTRVIYPKDDGVVSLVYVETETELASARFADWGRLPSWSPNGEYLTILNREGNVEEFYLISRDGNEFQRITNFAEEFGHASIPEYTWSPNGERIAFWLNLEAGDLKDGAQSELAILDIPSGQVTKLCVQGISVNAYEPWTMNHPEPVWSPDGRYIMITQWDDAAAPKKYYVLVVDTETGSVEKISENTAPIGWMTSEP